MKHTDARRFLAWLMKRAAVVFFICASASVMAADVSLTDSDDGFGPLGLAVAFIFGCVALSLVGIGIVIAATVALALAAMTMLGIVSTSVLAGIFKRRFSTGIRAFHYQLCAAAGVPAGVGVLWFGTRFFHIHMRDRDALWIGAIAGICGGLILAFIFDQAVRIACRRLLAVVNRNISKNDVTLPQKS